jgi:hypothetical protein
LASTVSDQDSPDRFDARKQAKDQIAPLTKALQLNPYLVPALFRLQHAYRLLNEPRKAAEVNARWQDLNPDQSKAAPGTGEILEKSYGAMGKYATVINPFSPPEPSGETEAPPPRFEAARRLQVKLADGERWVKPSDFTGSTAVIGRVRARFGAAIAAFDADGDENLDLYLASAVVGPKGIRDALLLNKGDGHFEDGSVSFGLPLDRASLGVAAADFDVAISTSSSQGSAPIASCATVRASRSRTSAPPSNRWARRLSRSRPAGSTWIRTATSTSMSSTIVRPNRPARRLTAPAVRLPE